MIGGLVDSRRIDPMLKRLTQLGIAVFLLIWAFDIHRWRREPWQRFDAGFHDLAASIFGQPERPVWLYALAFPFVAANFGCMVLILRGRRTGILPVFIGSAVMIAIMPMFARQVVVERMVWEQILTAFGYAIGGAIAIILARQNSAGLGPSNAGTKLLPQKKVD